MNQTRILIAEDEKKSFEILKRVLVGNGWTVENASNGEEALKILKDSYFHVLVTDLNMPKMNGMELINRVQTEIRPKPKIIMTTAYGSPEVRKRAMDLGAYAFFTKPLDYKEFSRVLYECLEKTRIDSPGIVHQNLNMERKKPPFVGVGIAVSTGGPQTLKNLFFRWNIPSEAAFFVVQHAPDWAIESITEQFVKDFGLKWELAKDGLSPQSGQVYIAPGNYHLCLDPVTFKMRLVDSLPENFLRPAADPLFRSCAESFGPVFLAVILTGLGRDGTQGGKIVVEMGGKVLIQDPKTAVAPFMPKAAIASGVKHQLVSLEGMRQAIQENVSRMAKHLRQQ